MLSVQVDLAAFAVMLIGIVFPQVSVEVDSLNDPTARPIPRAKLKWVMCKSVQEVGQKLFIVATTTIVCPHIAPRPTFVARLFSPSWPRRASDRANGATGGHPRQVSANLVARGAAGVAETQRRGHTVIPAPALMQ